MEIATRFWRKVKRGPPDECWPWTGRRGGRGYGRVGSCGAHRLAWELTNGAIPAGLWVLHRCDNPPCVNPSHLWLGTHADNMADMRAKGRSARGDRHGSRLHPERRPRGERHGSRTQPERAARGERNGSLTRPDRVPRGERHHARLRPERLARGERSGSAKLTESAVREIRGLLAERVSLRAIGRRFGVNPVTIWFVAHGKTWKHVV